MDCQSSAVESPVVDLIRSRFILVTCVFRGLRCVEGLFGRAVYWLVCVCVGLCLYMKLRAHGLAVAHVTECDLVPQRGRRSCNIGSRAVRKVPV